MTSENLRKLYDAKEKAFSHYQAMQHLNVNGRTRDERIEMDIAAEKARQDWFKAMTDYTRAVEAEVKK